MTLPASCPDANPIYLLILPSLAPHLTLPSEPA
jgi:hypothetical protein